MGGWRDDAKEDYSGRQLSCREPLSSRDCTQTWPGLRTTRGKTRSSAVTPFGRSGGRPAGGGGGGGAGTSGGAGGGAGVAVLSRAFAGSAHSPASAAPRGETQMALSQMRSPLQSVSFEQPAARTTSDAAVRLSTGAPFESGDSDAADGGREAGIGPVRGLIRVRAVRGPLARPGGS